MDDDAQHGVVALLPRASFRVDVQEAAAVGVAGDQGPVGRAQAVGGVDDGADARPRRVGRREVVDGEHLTVVRLVATDHGRGDRVTGDVGDAPADVSDDQVEPSGFGDAARGGQVEAGLVVERDGEQRGVEQAAADHFLHAHDLDVSRSDAVELVVGELQLDLVLEDDVLGPEPGIRDTTSRRRGEPLDGVGGEVVEHLAVDQRTGHRAGRQHPIPGLGDAVPLGEPQHRHHDHLAERRRGDAPEIGGDDGLHGRRIVVHRAGRIADECRHGRRALVAEPADGFVEAVVVATDEDQPALGQHRDGITHLFDPFGRRCRRNRRRERVTTRGRLVRSLRGGRLQCECRRGGRSRALARAIAARQHDRRGAQDPHLPAHSRDGTPFRTAADGAGQGTRARTGTPIGPFHRHSPFALQALWEVSSSTIAFGSSHPPEHTVDQQQGRVVVAARQFVADRLGDAVLEQDALIIAEERIPEGGLHADAGGAAGEDECAHAQGLQHVVELGFEEAAEPGLVDDRVHLVGRELVDDLCSPCASDHVAAGRSVGKFARLAHTDPSVDLRPVRCVRSPRIGQIRVIAHPQVDDLHSDRTNDFEQPRDRRDHSLDR